MNFTRVSSTTVLIVMIAFTAIPTIAAPPAKVGPQTEKRFPPLKLPKGFKATLFACDPLVEYPSVISLGPRPGTMFVAHDYVTGLGIKIVRRDEIRLLSDTDGDAYADKSTVYASGFNSIQGLNYYNGTMFVMHAPVLTALKDTNGDGKADTRRDIVTGLGIPPEENPNRLHCANGVVAAHDGWLYLALGDRGCDVKRPEGDRLVFRQGGVLRCRPDGRDLHVFAGGMRNIYDVALDEELNLFVRDNENDGGDYMIRVFRSFFGADHGYPYHYYERPDEALRPLADLGRGSSAGGTSYLETAFPQEFRESLFFCEWGRAVVRYRRERAGSSFKTMSEVDFAAGAPNDPYGFKPTDIVVDYDGSILISDWGDGQRPKRGRGRIYRIKYVGPSEHDRLPKPIKSKSTLADLLGVLNSNSSHTRVAAQLEIERRGKSAMVSLKRALRENRLSPIARFHAIWILAHHGGKDTQTDLFRIAEKDNDPRVRAQAVRALADLTDPVLVRHRLATGRGDEKTIKRLAALVTKQQDSRVVLEVLVALGRLRWLSAPTWLRDHWPSIDEDPALAHAAMQLLRRAGNWPSVLKLLEEPQTNRKQRTDLRTLALRAVADRAETAIVDGLIHRLASETDATKRGEYVDTLARVYKKRPAWVYWEFRPAPRPANTVAWQRTETIATVLDGALTDPAPEVRTLALKRMRREQIPIRLATLAAALRTEKNAKHMSAILDALVDFPASDVRELLEGVVGNKSLDGGNRLKAFSSFAGGLDEKSQTRLHGIAKTIEDGPVLAAVLRELGRRKSIPIGRLLLSKLESPLATVRAAAIGALAARRSTAATSRVIAMLSDSDVRVRRAAATAAGTLKVAKAVALLRTAAASSDRDLCRAGLTSLSQLHATGAVPQAVIALAHRETQSAALEYLREFGSAPQAEEISKLAASNRSTEVTIGIVRALTHWSSKLLSTSKTRRQLERTIAEVHQQNGVLLQWSITGPLTLANADALMKELNSASSTASLSSKGNWRSRIATGTDAMIKLPKAKGGNVRVAVSHVFADKPMLVEFLAGGDGQLRIWLNRRLLFTEETGGVFRPDFHRFDAHLVKGMNRLVVRIDGKRRDPRFHLRFRRKSSKAEHERLVQLALTERGSALRGREVFFKAERSQCVKCHRIGETGGRIGPDLTGIGNRFSKIHLVESMLEPSRTIAPSYATMVVALANGRVVTGVKISETAKTLTLGDNQGKLHTFAKSDIEVTRAQSKSTMPDGLEKRISDREFVDLLSFLLSQKKRSSSRTRPKR